MKYFHFYKKEEILHHTKIRKFETKVGEKVCTVNPSELLSEALNRNTCRYVIFGIEEDIGIRANNHKGTSKSFWKDFLHDFLNMQALDTLELEHVLLLGSFDFSEIESLIENNARDLEESTDALRHAVANIVDEEVETLTKLIASAGKIPIAIGGGQNNVYPLLKGCAKGFYKSGVLAKPVLNANCLDLDSNFKFTEGRHSGNGYRYAMDESYLDKYALTGIHEYVNAQSVMDDIYSNVNIQYFSYKEIFVDERLNFRQAIARSFSFTEDIPVGLHVNMNCIRNLKTSLNGSVGFSSVEARQFVCYSTNFDIAYLYLSEGHGVEAIENIHLLSVLVLDFLSSKA